MLKGYCQVSLFAILLELEEKNYMKETDNTLWIHFSIVLEKSLCTRSYSISICALEIFYKHFHQMRGLKKRTSFYVGTQKTTEQMSNQNSFTLLSLCLWCVCIGEERKRIFSLGSFVFKLNRTNFPISSNKRRTWNEHKKKKTNRKREFVRASAGDSLFIGNIVNINRYISQWRHLIRSVYECSWVNCLSFRSTPNGRCYERKTFPSLPHQWHFNFRLIVFHEGICNSIAIETWWRAMPINN